SCTRDRRVGQSGGCRCGRAIDTFNFNVLPPDQSFSPAFDFAQVVAPRVFGIPVALATDKSAQVEAPKLLADMYRHGAELKADGYMTKAIVEEIKREGRR